MSKLDTALWIIVIIFAMVVIALACATIGTPLPQGAQ